jgi:hypothetical protein
MNSPMNQAPPTMPRSEQLQQAFAEFIDVDSSLWSIRQEIGGHHEALSGLENRKLELEKTWGDRSRKLAEIMTREAPQFVMQQIKEEQYATEQARLQQGINVPVAQRAPINGAAQSRY